MFLLTGENAKSYRHQYASIYFLRLTRLKGVVLNQAQKKWEDVAGKIALSWFVENPSHTVCSGNPVHVSKILDVVKSELCYIVGTVYMDMPLKPNVLTDIAKEVCLKFVIPSALYLYFYFPLSMLSIGSKPPLPSRSTPLPKMALCSKTHPDVFNSWVTCYPS